MPSSPPPAVPAAASTWPTVSVVLPALNEERNLPLVLEGLPPVDEVVVVDGGSVDDTVAVAREVRPDALVIRQTRSGKGNALLCGFAACSGDIVITLNADGSTDPGEIPRYVDALLAGAEVAHGSRYREGGANLDESRWERIGRIGYNRAVNLFFGTRFTDLGYGFNAYWRALLPVLDLPDPGARTPKRGMRLWGEGPEIEPLINIRMATQGLRVVEVASVGYPRIYGVSDHRPVRDGARAVRAAAGEYVRRWQISREVNRHPGMHAVREEPRTVGRRAAGQRGTAARLAGIIPALRMPVMRIPVMRMPAGATPTGRHAAERPAGRGDRQASVPRQGGPDPSGTGPSGNGPSGNGPSGNGPSGNGLPGNGPSGAQPAAASSDGATPPDRAAREWAEQQWARDRWAEQRSWRETYADPAAAGPRPGTERRHPAPYPAGSPDLAGAGPDVASPGPDHAGARPTRAARRNRRRGPDLTVITGDGSRPAEGRPESPYRAPLRAVPGEAYERD